MIQLKYLFNVRYKDGTFFSQNPEDVSATDPKRSAFFDVKQDQVTHFELVGNGNSFIVDLADGSFYINGVQIFLHDNFELTDFRLIFFRRHRHHFTLGMQEVGHEIAYHIGWQCTYDGKNYQETIIVN